MIFLWTSNWKLSSHVFLSVSVVDNFCRKKFMVKKFSTSATEVWTSPIGIVKRKKATESGKNSADFLIRLTTASKELVNFLLYLYF